jgi:hypothetical protein
VSTFVDEATWRRIPLEDHDLICVRVERGETLQEVADDYDCSRERIRQIVGITSSAAKTNAKAFADAGQRERASVIAEIRLVQRALRNGPCRVCLGPVTQRRRGKRWQPGEMTCSPRCSNLWKRLRYHLDDSYRQALREAQARSVLNHSADPVRRRHAERHLAGEVTQRGRWHQADSTIPDALQEVAELRAAVQASGGQWWV